MYIFIKDNQIYRRNDVALISICQTAPGEVLPSEPPELPPGEVSLVISGMTGTFFGLENGTHALNGEESLTSSRHTWSTGSPSQDYIMFMNNTQGGMSDTSNVSGFKFYYQGSGEMEYWTNTSVPASPSIKDSTVSQNHIINNVIFTTSKGTGWSRGNM